MKSLIYICFMISLVLVAPTSAMAQTDKEKKRKENTIFLHLRDGKVVIKLFPDVAPKHVERIKKLTREGFYNGLKFHRVIEGFMAQTGDPLGNGTGGSNYSNLQAEFNKKPFKRGTLGAARSNDPNSANSQFFICFEAAPWLNGQYTVFGEVISGMEFVDLIKRGHPQTGQVNKPDIIKKMEVEADAG